MLGYCGNYLLIPAEYTNPRFTTVNSEDENRRDNLCCHESDLIACYIGGFVVCLQNKPIVTRYNKLIIARRNKLIVAQQDKLKDVRHALSDLKSGDGH